MPVTVQLCEMTAAAAARWQIQGGLAQLPPGPGRTPCTGLSDGSQTDRQTVSQSVRQTDRQTDRRVTWKCECVTVEGRAGEVSGV